MGGMIDTLMANITNKNICIQNFKFDHIAWLGRDFIQNLKALTMCDT